MSALLEDVPAFCYELTHNPQRMQLLEQPPTEAEQQARAERGLPCHRCGEPAQVALATSVKLKLPLELRWLDLCAPCGDWFNQWPGWQR